MAHLKTLIIEKSRALGMHLSISCIVFVSIIGTLLLFWYPAPYYRLDGLWNGLRITLAVDLVLGPLATLVVFRKGKRGLVFDLTLIAAVQFAALAFGIYTIFQQRPYFVVFAENQFQTVRWVDIINRGLPEDQLRALHNKAPGHPPIIAVRPPKDENEEVAMMLEVFTKENMAYSFFVQRYTLITEEIRSTIMATALPASGLNAGQKKSVEAFCKAEGKNLSDVAIFPLVGRFSEALIAFDKTTGQFLGYPD